MKTNLKKVLATLWLVSIVAMNSVYAVQVGTGTITSGSTSAINSTWDWIADPDGSSASGSLNVQVSAQVVPTLNMTISTWAINFGVLAPNAAQTGTLTIDTATNAEGGITIAMESTGLQSATKYIWDRVGTVWNVATTDATDYYTVSSSTNNSGTPLALASIASTQPVLVSDNVAKSNATTTVEISAMAGAQTEAGNYGDTLTFTVTGNF